MRKKMCDICGVKEAVYTCHNCGSDVCEEHYSKRLGMCTNCPKR